MENKPDKKPDNEPSKLDGLKGIFIIFGPFLILIGLVFAIQKEVYQSFTFFGATIHETKLNEHDAMWTGIVMILIGVLMIGAFFYLLRKSKSKLPL
jgi:hypothetical protein